VTGVLADPAAAAAEASRPGRPAGWRSPAALVAVALAVVGAGYRLALLAVELPPTNSDEATMGLAALHILDGRDFPAFFYGQHYMGTIEAYLAAPIFAVAGPSVLALRLPNLLLYLGFLAAMWVLTRRLYTPWFATFTVGLLALGSDRIIKNQLIAGGGYPELNPAAALLVLLAVNLARGSVRHPLRVYAVWGLVAGVMVWDEWLVLPYLAAAAMLLVWRRGRDLRGPVGVVVGAAAVVGAAPLIVDYAVGGHNPIAVFRALSEGGDASWADRLHGGLLFGVPMGTGMCSPGHCAPWQLWWGVAVPVLLVVAGTAAVRALRSAQGDERVRQAGRFALVAAAAVTLIAYARSDAAGATPVESARYLSCLLVSLPAVLWPLWSAGSRARPVVRSAAVAAVAAVVVTAVMATAGLVARGQTTAGQAVRRAELVAALRGLGVTRFYSDYWTCNTVTFATREELVCAVLGDDLRPGYDRYRPYRDMVAAADRPGYAVRTGSALGAAVRERLAAGGAGAAIATAGGYDIYLPPRDVPLPVR
jgi:hypothetical protein